VKTALTVEGVADLDVVDGQLCVGLAYLAAQIGHQPTLVRVLFGVAGCVLALACLILLLEVLRSSNTATGYDRYAALPIHEVAAYLRGRSGPYAQVGDLAVTSRVVARKNRRLRRAVELAAVTVLLIASGPVVGMIA
jgi:hypothetical protein